MKIVLIEDHPDVRENTAEILTLAGYEVFTAPNGKLGIETVKKHMPDLILCDIMMPELDGYGVMHVLSRSDDTARIPFIFLTAKADKTDIRKGMTMGADDYLTKPFDDIELLNAIETRLKKYALLTASQKLEKMEELVQRVRGMEELKKLIAESRRTHYYKKKQPIFTEGSLPNNIYFIIKGKVKLYRTNEEGREYITNLLHDGDFFGYLDVLENHEYSESAAAMDVSEICHIPKIEFLALMQSSKEVSETFIKLLADNLKDKEDKLLKLAYNSVRKRVAESLLFVLETYNTAHKDPSEILLPISREDLSSIVGASKETVIRTLSDFKDEGLIEMEGTKIKILKLEKLQRMRN